VSNITSTANAPTETWTLTCISESSDGGVFSVEGSVSGVYSEEATVGVPYDNGTISFTINDGNTDFEFGDTIEIPVTQGVLSQQGIEWEILRFDDTHPVSTVNAWQLIMKGKGFTSDEEIYVGMYLYQSVGSDYYNFTVATMRGFLESASFVTQPGISPRCSVCGHNISITYWLSVNAQRINCVMKVGTPVYEMFSIGKFFPYAFPSDYAQPLIAIGMMEGSSAAIRYSDTTTNHSMGLRGNSGMLQMFRQDGSWVKALCSPWSFASNNIKLATQIKPAGTSTANYVYPIIPIELYQTSPSNIYGKIDGFYWITGFDNITENTVSVGGRNFVIIQDAFRTDFDDYFAMELN
jgi:hypothetical protein